MLSRLCFAAAAALTLTACDPAARCDRGIESAGEDLREARDSKSGFAKASPDLLKATALLGAAEVQRVAKDYEACIAKVGEARDAIKAARKAD